MVSGFIQINKILLLLTAGIVSLNLTSIEHKAVTLSVAAELILLNNFLKQTTQTELVNLWAQAL